MSTKVTLLSATAVSFLLHVYPVAAQSTVSENDQDSNSNSTLEEVLVTAQKRSERLLDVPMSLTALSEAQLRSAAISSSLELGQVVPGLLLTNIGTGLTPAIRGVSSSGTSVGDAANVAIYVDDVEMGDTLAGYFDLPDIERIEVLKGPQGTLFGRNATGGAIRMVTRAPQFEREGKINVDYGFAWKEKRLSAFFTGPINDTVAYSFSAAVKEGDGYIIGSGPNEGLRFGGPDNFIYRGKLLFKPSDTFQMTIAADTSRMDNDAAATPAAKGQNPFPFPGVVPNTAGFYAGGTTPMQLVESDNVILDATWNLSNDLTMRSITGYRKHLLTYQVDIDRTSGPFVGFDLNARQKNFSQEFNLFGPSDADVTWMAGAYYYSSDAGNDYFRVYLGDAPAGLLYTAFATDMDASSFAGFADVTWHLSEQLNITLGARYTQETKEYRWRDVYLLTGAPLLSATNKKTWNSPTFRAVARYDLSDDSNVYASLSNGFKSGVFNALAKATNPVEPEEIDALELGLKRRLSNGMTVAAAVYAYNYDQLQVQAQSLQGGALILTLSNAASAEIRGVEFSIDGNLTDHLSFSAGANWMPTAEYTDYKTAQVTVPITGSEPIIGQQIVPYDASGSRLIKAPDWLVNLRLTYATQVKGGEFAATINEGYSSKFNWQPGDLTFSPSRSMINARLSWTDPTGRYTYSWWGTNLADESYSTYTSPNTRGDTQVFAPQRLIGIGFSASF
jgi:iron complex outermembrane receptor protein